MLSRDLEVISTYFRVVLESAPQHAEQVRNILDNISQMKDKSDFALDMSILLTRSDSEECTICKKQVICNE